MAEEVFHFLRPHFLRMPDAMKTDVALDPLDVNLFGARAVAVDAHGGSDLIQQFWRFSAGRDREIHAAFVGALPSQGQEIDCTNGLRRALLETLDRFHAAFLSAFPSRRPEIYGKLQSNSR